jgi:phosphoenolpyruvate carboxykinase (ATP)
MSDTGLRVPDFRTVLPDPAAAENVTYDPSRARLRAFSSPLETTTEYRSPAYVTEHRSRCADRTKNALDDEFDATDYGHVETAVEYARAHEMVCLDRQVGRHDALSFTCRYYVPREHGRIALAMETLFEPAAPDAEPDFVTVQVPDHDEVAIRVLPEAGVTAVLGSDYTGEAKKSFLRLFMFRAKQRGGLGLHAGSKRVRLAADDGTTDTVGQLFLGLSATGKSTLTAHGMGLDPPEDAVLLQDDVCALLPDGTVAGSEGNGLYVKTIGLERAEQPAVYDAATHESAVLENVAVGPDGAVDFDSDEHTANGRAVVRREHLASADDAIDLDRLDQVFFITRNPAMPPVARLTAEEAAAAFMLGESIRTSAGDPSRAGESVRVVGTNPFIVGPAGEEGNRFRDLIADLDVDCYVLNTGQVGDPGTDVGVEDTVTILRELARDRVAWTVDEATGLTVPGEVPGLDVDAFDVADNLPDHERRLRELRAERRSHLAAFEDLDEAIQDAVY